MVEKVKKVTATVGDATLQRRGVISFPQKYKKWQQECRNLGPEKIGGKVNLLTWLKRHGKPSSKPSRKGSPNTGLSGISVLMAFITRKIFLTLRIFWTI